MNYIDLIQRNTIPTRVFYDDTKVSEENKAVLSEFCFLCTHWKQKKDETHIKYCHFDYPLGLVVKERKCPHFYRLYAKGDIIVKTRINGLNNNLVTRNMNEAFRTCNEALNLIGINGKDNTLTLEYGDMRREYKFSGDKENPIRTTIFKRQGAKFLNFGIFNDGHNIVEHTIYEYFKNIGMM